MSRRDCNNCEVKGCTIYEDINSRDCKVYRPPASFKSPMLLHLLSNDKKVWNTMEVLNKFNISISETGRYPFFKLNSI